MHLSTHLPADLWVVELRSSSGDEPVLDGKSGEVLSLPAGASMVLLTPYLSERRQSDDEPNRLWISTLNLPVNLMIIWTVTDHPSSTATSGRAGLRLLPDGLRH